MRQSWFVATHGSFRSGRYGDGTQTTDRPLRAPPVTTEKWLPSEWPIGCPSGSGLAAAPKKRLVAALLRLRSGPGAVPAAPASATDSLLECPAPPTPPPGPPPSLPHCQDAAAAAKASTASEYWAKVQWKFPLAGHCGRRSDEDMKVFS